LIEFVAIGVTYILYVAYAR